MASPPSAGADAASTDSSCLQNPPKAYAIFIGQHTSIASNRVGAMDITEFHESMQDKYAEKRAREHRFWMALELLVFSSLGILAFLWYAAK